MRYDRARLSSTDTPPQSSPLSSPMPLLCLCWAFCATGKIWVPDSDIGAAAIHRLAPRSWSRTPVPRPRNLGATDRSSARGTRRAWRRDLRTVGERPFQRRTAWSIPRTPRLARECAIVNRGVPTCSIDTFGRTELSPCHPERDLQPLAMYRKCMNPPSSGQSSAVHLVLRCPGITPGQPNCAAQATQSNTIRTASSQIWEQGVGSSSLPIPTAGTRRLVAVVCQRR